MEEAAITHGKRIAVKFCLIDCDPIRFVLNQNIYLSRSFIRTPNQILQSLYRLLSRECSHSIYRLHDHDLYLETRNLGIEDDVLPYEVYRAQKKATGAGGAANTAAGVQRVRRCRRVVLTVLTAVVCNLRVCVGFVWSSRL